MDAIAWTSPREASYRKLLGDVVNMLYWLGSNNIG